MSQDLSTTSYALLGLLALDGTDSSSLTGYELKRRADRTLRFYWVAPAMSQVYSELQRLTRRGLVDATSARQGRRRTQRFQITTTGLDVLQHWLRSSEAQFPVLKHPTALRLLMGALIGPHEMTVQLQTYLDQLVERRRELAEVRAMLGEDDTVRYPALVADWGLGYYDAEAAIVAELMDKLASFPPLAGSSVPSERAGAPR